MSHFILKRTDTDAQIITEAERKLMFRPRQPLDTVVGTWNGGATIWTSNPSYLGPYTNTFSTTLTFTGTPGSLWNASNETYSLSLTAHELVTVNAVDVTCLPVGLWQRYASNCLAQSRFLVFFLE